MSLPQEIIRRKRDGITLDDDELSAIVKGITEQTLSEGQIAAFAMAVFFRGLSNTERVAFTRAMTHSGSVLNWSRANLNGPVLDKHSTGGVGDKVSIMLAPMLAAYGAYVPMISGRGLGHTGGTLDKLDSIPGYNATPDLATLQRVLPQTGCAIIGQTPELAPADRRLYAIRDVTATVESIDLIVPSILSKKLAAGLQGLVMDVKVGSGAFMTDISEAEVLANTLIDVANGAGLPTTALITDMNQVLGYSAGNALEMKEALAYLSGQPRNRRLHEVVLGLASELLVLGKLAANTDQASVQLEQVLANGQAVECFAKMVAALGGPKDLLERTDYYLPAAKIVKPVLATRKAYVSAMDARAVGMAVIELGGGRMTPQDGIDYQVGFSDICQIGDYIDVDQPLAVLHASSEDAADKAAAKLQQAITLTDEPGQELPVIYKKLN